MALTQEQITKCGWMFKNDAYTRMNLLMKVKGDTTVIIRKEGDYPTVFEGELHTEEELKAVMKRLQAEYK